MFSGQLNINLQSLFSPRQDAAETAEVAGIHHNIQVTDHPLGPLSLLQNRPAGCYGSDVCKITGFKPGQKSQKLLMLACSLDVITRVNIAK